jgi:glycosyltransferase involved in cell wall biosynthesis
MNMPESVPDMISEHSVNEQPLVTLVTPTRNQAQFLAATIDSVLAQDYQPLEYIVLDDGSTDETRDVLARYDSRLRWRSHANIGQAATLNKGWAMGRGEFIGYLSSDDCLNPGAIRQLVQALRAHPEAVVAYADFDLVDVAGRYLRHVRTEDFNLRRLTVDLVCQPGVGVLFRRSVFTRTGGWNKALRQIPDFEFWLRAVQFGSFVRVSQVLGQYRIHSGSASFGATSPQRSLEMVRTMTAFWGREHSPERRRSIGLAALMAAKSHAQSGRFGSYAAQCARALRSDPSLLWSNQAWRLVFSGLLGRVRYRGRA